MAEQTYIIDEENNLILVDKVVEAAPSTTPDGTVPGTALNLEATFAEPVLRLEVRK